MPRVIILIAPPGAGKGTQAELLAKHYGLFHFETSKIIEQKFQEVGTDDTVMMREKQRWLAGELNNKALVVAWVLEAVRQKAEAGKGVVFSGSPRTLEEVEAEMPVLEKLYGKDNITIFNITLSEAESIKRNSARRVCQANRHPIPNFPKYAGTTTCPQDGSPLTIRELDNPATIKERYRVYLEETAPVLEHLGQHHYSVNQIDGEQTIEQVFTDITSQLASA